MKIAATVASALLGLIYVVFGVNMMIGLFGGQMPIQPPPMDGKDGEFLGLLGGSGFMHVVKLLEIVGGAMLIASIFIKRLAPLALVLLTPITVSIFLFHLFFQGIATTPMAVFMLVCTGVIAARYWDNLKGIVEPHRS